MKPSRLWAQIEAVDNRGWFRMAYGRIRCAVADAGAERFYVERFNTRRSLNRLRACGWDEA